jgi:hypothetical protein
MVTDLVTILPRIDTSARAGGPGEGREEPLEPVFQERFQRIVFHNAVSITRFKKRSFLPASLRLLAVTLRCLLAGLDGRGGGAQVYCEGDGCPRGDCVYSAERVDSAVTDIGVRARGLDTVSGREENASYCCRALVWILA